MAKRLAFTFFVTVLGTSALFTACADDGDRVDDVSGGEAGNDAGADSGGSSSGGSSAGKGGSPSPTGGQMQGGQSQGGAGAAGDGGMAGEAGDTTVGGAPLGGGGATDEGGAAGAGGAGNPPVAYACGDTTLSRRLCSAYIAAECDSLPACTGEPPPEQCCTDCPAPVCPDCVAQTDVERQTFTECPACLAEYDRSLLCGIEPFEAGNLSEGIACFDGFGAYQVEACDPLLFSAFDCLDYIVENACPESWPLE